MKNMILGLAVLIVVTGAVAAQAHALQSLLPPLDQVRAGVPIHDVQCADAKVLMETPRGTPACVFEATFEKLKVRGWLYISDKTGMSYNMTGNDAASTSSVIYAPHIYTAEGGHTHMGSNVRPFVTLEVPGSINVGETASINYTASWTYPNGTSTLPDKSYIDTFSPVLILELPAEFDILNDDKRFVFRLGDYSSTHYISSYHVPFPYSEGVVNGSVKIRMDRPMKYNVDVFNLNTGRNASSFALEKTDFGVVFHDMRGVNPVVHYTYEGRTQVWFNGEGPFTDPSDIRELASVSLADALIVDPGGIKHPINLDRYGFSGCSYFKSETGELC